MAIAWIMCPYKRRVGDTKPTRYPAIKDFQAQIDADGGAWCETEVLGNFAIVKVRASDTLIATISSQPEFLYLLGDTPLDTLMSNLSAQERNVINTRLKTQGYPQAEIDAALGSNLNQWQQHTYRDLLNLSATRRLRARYDAPSDTIVCDGAAIAPPRSIAFVDTQVQ